MKYWLKKLLVILVLLEAVYLVLINLALNLPYTQMLINDIKPDKFAINYESAWSLYPFNVHTRGIAANGQSRSQQWQIEASAASAVISVPALIWRAVSIKNLSVTDLVYYQRPRTRPDKEYSNIDGFFPVIKDRNPQDPADTSPPKRGNGWKIKLTDIQAKGSHRFWIYQLNGALDGDLHTDLTYQTRGGPLALSNGAVNVSLSSLEVNDGQEISKKGFIKGTVGFSPFVPSQNKGLKSLVFLNLDADIDIETDSLAFLNFYLARFHDMKIDGTGNSTGHLQIKNGKFQAGSDMSVTARNLSLGLYSHRVEGAGTVNLKVDPDRPEKTNVGIYFDTLEAFPPNSSKPLFYGRGLSVKGRGAIALMPLKDPEPMADLISIDIPSVKVPDLRAFQRYLPENWSFKLHGGQGEFHGNAALSQTSVSTRLKLQSTAADVGLKDNQFKTELYMELNAHSPSLVPAGIDLSGTTIRLRDAQLSSQGHGDSAPWHGFLRIEKGAIKLDLPETGGRKLGSEDLFHLLKGKEIYPLLNTGDSPLRLSGSISDLRWMNQLLENPTKMAIRGGGQMTAEVGIASGWLAEGTRLDIQPRELAVDVMDYTATGDGRVTVVVEKGGSSPDVLLVAKLDDALLKRRGEKEAFIEDVSLVLKATGERMSYTGPGEKIKIHFRIPSATVRDMSVYNRYLPAGSPLQLLGGEARLTTDMKLEPDFAAGILRLQTKGLRSRIEAQEVSGDLTVDINIAGGIPREMAFNISGSALTLDNVKVKGRQGNFEQSGWNARWNLRNGHAVWKIPPHVHFDSTFELSDTRPLVVLMSNQRGKHGWIERILNVGNVRGVASLAMENDKITIPNAHAGSDDITLGAKGIITDGSREGMFYMRYKKLHGTLKIRDNNRNFDVIHAKRTFDEYTP